MTGLQWFQIAESLVTTVLLVLLWTGRVGFTGGRWSGQLAFRLDAFEARMSVLESRLDKAGHEISNLATYVQALPERLRKEFVLNEVHQLCTAELRDDRARLHADLIDLRRRLETNTRAREPNE